MVLLDLAEIDALMRGIDYQSTAELLAAAVRPPRWHDEAACRGRGRRLFFPLRGESATEARGVCATCPVRLPCVSAALEDPDTVGVWGGSSSRQRRRARTEGWDAQRLLDDVDTVPLRDDTPSTWKTAPCRSCGGLLGRKDLERNDGWCWACRPVAKPGVGRAATRRPRDAPVQ